MNIKRKLRFLWKAFKYLFFNKEPFVIIQTISAISNIEMVQAKFSKELIDYKKNKWYLSLELRLKNDLFTIEKQSYLKYYTSTYN